MLALSDPFWSMLETPHADTDLPAALAELDASRDAERAAEFCWTHLSHQGTLYAASYAAAPHLLALAEASEASGFRTALAGFLSATVVRHPVSTGSGCDGAPQETGRLSGLPLTLEEWQAKTWLPDARCPSTEAHLAVLRKIEAAYLALIPKIEALCRAELRQGTDDPSDELLLLAAPVACAGSPGVARRLELGIEDSWFKCHACEAPIVIRLEDVQEAFYSAPASGEEAFSMPSLSRDGGADPAHRISPGDLPAALTGLRLSPEALAHVRLLFGLAACPACGVKTGVTLEHA